MRSRRRTIIITGLIAILISYILMNPKKEDKPYFTLYIGDKAEQIEMTDDWQGTKKTILDKLEPLWENLDTGDSEVFYIEVVDNSPPEWVDTEKMEKKGKVTFAVKTTSDKYRFYKNRKSTPIGLPMFGYDTVDEEGRGKREVKSNSSQWSTIREVLRTRFDYFKDDFVL